MRRASAAIIPCETVTRLCIFSSASLSITHWIKCLSEKREDSAPSPQWGNPPVQRKVEPYISPLELKPVLVEYDGVQHMVGTHLLLRGLPPGLTKRDFMHTLASWGISGTSTDISSKGEATVVFASPEDTKKCVEQIAQWEDGNVVPRGGLREDLVLNKYYKNNPKARRW